MGWKRTAIGAALFAACLCGHRVLLVVVGLVCGNGLLDIFKRQKQLLGIELLRTSPKLRPLQLAQKMPQAIDLRKRPIALGDGSIALCTHRRYQRMQRLDIGRKLGCDLAHARH